MGKCVGASIIRVLCKLNVAREIQALKYKAVNSYLFHIIDICLVVGIARRWKNIGDAYSWVIVSRAVEFSRGDKTSDKAFSSKLISN